MMDKSLKLLCVAVLLAATGCAGSKATGQAPADSRAEVYKTVGQTKLNLYIFRDAKLEDGKPRPAIVFFFGGGWSTGSPRQFEPQARYFASRGMVAISADYRIRTRDNSKVTDSVSDARSAIRWVRANAKRLGIDPSRIAAGGGSAGGHLAASTAFISEFDDPTEDKKVSAAPNALVLFNPALVLAPLAGLDIGNAGSRLNASLLGAEPTKVSPAHHVKAGGPPTIIFHGESDSTVPFSTAKAFTEKMKAAGNQCQLISFPGQQHGFFNSEPSRSKTLKSADEFLTALGWLKAKSDMKTGL